MIPTATRKIRLSPYVAAILLMPLLVLWRQDNSLFPSAGIDSWVYLGFFRNLVDFKRDLFPGTYYGSRLSWILPGYAAHALFSPVAAAAILHLAVHAVAVLSLFATLKGTIGVRRAFVAAMLFSLHPGLWRAIGWDYVDGIGIAYCLLAFAFFHRASEVARPRVALLAAGISVAAMIYVNLFLVTLAPVLPLGYLLMARHRHRTSWKRLLLALGLWTGAGFGVVTVVLGCLNYSIDGHFWFYAPSIRAAVDLVSRKNPWFEGIWGPHGLESWLWFAVVAAILAVRILLSHPWKSPRREDLAAALFSGQLLFVVAWMIFNQVRGNPVLGVYYYASYMLPFVFLAIGAALPEALDALSPKAYTLVCAITALALAGLWADRAGRIVPMPPALTAQTALLAGAALALSQLLRRPTARIVLALVGFTALTAEVRNDIPADPHNYRRRYEAVMQVRARIEAIRKGRPVRFQYDPHDARVDEYTALNSTYLWWFTQLRADRTRPDWCLDFLDTVIVTASSSPEVGSNSSGQSIDRCWSLNGLNTKPADVVRVDIGEPAYYVTIVPVGVPGIWRALRLVSDSNGKAVLNPVAGTLVPPSLPMGSWFVLQGGELTDVSRAGTGEFLFRTPGGRKSVAALYPPITVPAAGRYRFALRYRPESGHFMFVAKAPSGANPWLAVRALEHKMETDSEAGFWVDLAAGQEIQLVLVNDTEGDTPVSFRMTGLTAVQLVR